MHVSNNSNLSTWGDGTSGDHDVRAAAEDVTQPSTSAGYSQQLASPIVAVLQPLSAEDVDAVLSPGSSPSADGRTPQLQQVPKALNLFGVVDKAHAQVQAEMAAGTPPLLIDTARIFQLQKSEVTDFRARNGLPPPLRGKGNEVTLAGTARHFGVNKVTLKTYVNEQGVFTDKAERSLDSSYKDYC